MANNKLSLIVSFTGNDKLSGPLKNLIGLGKNGKQALDGMFRELRNVKKEMQELDKEIAKGTGNTEELTAKQRNLASQLERVNAQIDRQKAINTFNANTNRIGQRGEQLKSAGTDNMLGAAGLATPLVLAGKAAMDFSSGMVDIAQKANLTQAQTDAMAQGILRAAEAAHQMPEAMRQGVDALSGFGIDPREAMQMISPIGRLGTAMKVDIADGAAAASANLQNLKVGLLDTGKALDIMAAGGNVGAFEVKDMARYFPSLTAQAQALGQSGLGAVADLTAALEIARRGAGTSEEAATNITNLLSKINSPTVQNAFKKNFGVDLPAALKAAYAKGKTPMEALAEITQKATGGDLSKLGLVVEDMQAQSALRTLILNMQDYRKIRGDLAKSGGTVDAAFKQREAQDASVAWESFKGTMSALAITLGATLLPAMTEFFGWVNQGISAISRWAQANPETAKSLMQLVTAFIAGKAALGALQFGFGSVLSGFASLRNVFMMVRGAFMLLAPIVTAIGIWPIVIGAAIAGVVFGLYWLYNNWSKVWTYIGSSVDKIKGIFHGLPEWMQWAGKMMLIGLIEGLKSIPIVGFVTTLGEKIIGAFRKPNQINSPSRTFMQMGGFLTQGLAIGINGGARLPLRAMGKMAAGVASAGALALSSPSLADAKNRVVDANARALEGPSSTVPDRKAKAAQADRPRPNLNLTLNIYQQPGEDAHDLAKRVADIIERKFGGGGGDMGDDF
ncbi:MULTISPECIES: phage tail tape measure protein [unclassified Novosphingobium]|uniref:phage tail tape measure protein n=1 Tax=unclassified Novosphingobium TaxID=2644732 RepID=UPI000D3166BF|nr:MULTISPECIES: phage tail tape measure protein [unclassified Novosphingobium]PTR08911.1 TP901 family phage tail tape measure protein [Novosphingobium sp. GV055]PUB01823.1 TP901 family phage tail tape measure protein [Novosphingobium sp. GV061]PUB17795.1 TP901 family phage tail tape measure protein [Novosphingobium sp. GV079]PUB40489.1 TP901 family phage tail tape measure protein [Novosphingobium sp. GV027]